jgi:hypothetical protein
LPIIRAKVSGSQDAQYDNSLLGWLQSLWNAVAGLFQPPTRIGVTK